MQDVAENEPNLHSQNSFLNAGDQPPSESFRQERSTARPNLSSKRGRGILTHNPATRLRQGNEEPNQEEQIIPDIYVRIVIRCLLARFLILSNCLK